MMKRKRQGQWSSAKGQGKTIQWLRDHVDYQHDYCLIWPFATIRGYGNFGYLGENYYAHAYMCELAHGPKPTPTHQPAHSCGRGEEACVNPRHLSWKTPAENQQDKRLHGTVNPVGRERFKLTWEHVNQIRALKGQKTQDELAEMFGVGRRNIGAILDGRSWTKPKTHFFLPQEDERLKALHAEGHSFNRIAKILGRADSSVGRRLRALGVVSAHT